MILQASERFALALVIMLVTIGASSAQNISGPPDDIRQIRQILDNISNGYRIRDARLAMRDYAADYMQYDLVEPMTDPGKEKNTEKTQNFFDTTVGPATVRYEIQSLVADHDHAYGFYLLHFAFTTKSGEKIEMHGRVTHIFARLNGKWQIVHEHDSQPSKLPASMDWRVKQ